MEPIITINEYPIGWEWLDKVPLKDFTWLIEIFSTMTDDTDTYDLDIRDVLKSYIIARYYGWEPKEEDLEEIISHTSFFDINIDDAIYEVLTMPREKITI